MPHRALRSSSSPTDDIRNMTASLILRLLMGLVCAGLAAPPGAVAQEAPVVTSMMVDGYGTSRRHAAIEIRPQFDQAVTVVGAPTLALTIGSRTRLATLDARHTGGGTVAFTYVVQQSDVDLDGISIAADALRLDGATIRNADGVDADLDLGDFTITNDPFLLVDGRTVGILWVSLERNGHADPVGRGERLTARLAFGDHVTVTGAPRFALQVGSRTRPALYNGWVEHRTDPDTGQLTSVLTFQYDVQTSDRAANGVSPASSWLDLHGGAIRDSLGMDANIDPGSYFAPDFAVDGGVDNPPMVTNTFVRPPRIFFSRGDTFAVGDPITVTVRFTEFVEVRTVIDTKLST